MTCLSSRSMMCCKVSFGALTYGAAVMVPSGPLRRMLGPLLPFFFFSRSMCAHSRRDDGAHDVFGLFALPRARVAVFLGTPRQQAHDALHQGLADGGRKQRDAHG